MPTVKIFIKKQCPRCPQAKQLGSEIEQDGGSVVCYDVETAEGLAEATFFGVQATPTIIVEDDGENILAEFRGQVPSREELLQLISS
jgi:protein-disulfide isomerase